MFFINKLFVLVLFASVTFTVQAQPAAKVIADCTITYAVTIAGESGNTSAVKTLYIKGRKTRSEIKNNNFYQATIFDTKTNEAVVLKEVGGDKYISMFPAEEWKKKNSRWDGVSISITSETKTILNYTCKKAIATMKNGNKFTVYFTADVQASATENPYQFKNIPGLILEYDSQSDEGKNIEFKATDIDLSPVPASKFAIPTSGYRII